MKAIFSLEVNPILHTCAWPSDTFWATQSWRGRPLNGVPRRHAACPPTKTITRFRIDRRSSAWARAAAKICWRSTDPFVGATPISAFARVDAEANSKRPTGSVGHFLKSVIGQQHALTHARHSDLALGQPCPFR